MGYTHYWRINVDVDRNKLAAAQYDMSLVLKEARTPLANGLGELGTEPQQEEGLLAFNGVSYPDNDLSHETFAWPPDFNDRFPDWSKGESWDTKVRTGPYINSRDSEGYAFDFCKTARKPYDAVVVACLIAAWRVLGDDIKISSDGSVDEFLHGAGEYYADQENCETGADLYERTFGIPAECPFSRDDVSG